MKELYSHIKRLEEIANGNGPWMVHDLSEWLRLELPRVVNLAETMQQEYAEMDANMVYRAEMESAAGETKPREVA